MTRSDGARMLFAGVVIACTAVWCPPALADFDDGLAAYNRRDFARAMEEWRPLAEAGDPRAQTALGTMYFNGQSVAKDDAEAANWLSKAANQGQVSAQYTLALMYDHGYGVEQDRVQAYKWLELALRASLGASRDEMSLRRDGVARTMTPEQISEAQRLADEWKPANP